MAKKTATKKTPAKRANARGRDGGAGRQAIGNLVIHNVDRLTPEERAAVATWLRAQAETLEGDHHFDRTFSANYYVEQRS